MGLNDGDVFEVSLLGAVTREGKPPDLLYAVSSHQPRAAICNLVQISGQILGQSRALFFGKLLVLLRFWDPAKMEVLYVGGFACSQNTSNSNGSSSRICIKFDIVFFSFGRHG